jgi:hypothetical protein
MTPMPSLVLSILVISVVFLAPRRRNFVARCEELVARLPNHLLAATSPYVGLLLLGRHDRAFWKASGGLAGQLRRLSVMFTFLQLIQIHYKEGRITAHDALTIWKRVVLQISFTLLALPEALVSYMIPQLPHMAARKSADFFHDLVLQSQALCVTPVAPACVLRVRDLL